MLQRIDYLLNKGVDFAFETTLSTRSYTKTIQRAQALGYTVTVFFVYLSSEEMAVSRVAKRVLLGGHNIPTDVICRRYERALKNFFKLYLPICNAFLIVDNSADEPVEIARGSLLLGTTVHDQNLWNFLLERYGKRD